MQKNLMWTLKQLHLSLEQYGKIQLEDMELSPTQCMRSLFPLPKMRTLSLLTLSRSNAASSDIRNPQVRNSMRIVLSRSSKAPAGASKRVSACWMSKYTGRLFFLFGGSTPRVGSMSS